MEYPSEITQMGMFHNHSTNLPHLNTWIDQIIDLTNTQTHKKQNKETNLQHPTTDTLVQALQRYDCVYKELLRQTSIYSDPLTKMYAKTWHGVFQLFEYMVSMLHYDDFRYANIDILQLSHNHSD